MGTVQKFYPTAEELSTINSTVRCPEDGCSSIFMSESNLNLHLVKTHKKENLMVSNLNIIKEYYCPEISCSYNNTKSFKTLKFLKQHYLKVHSPKIYECSSCDMKFSTQSAKNSHIDYCNAKFTCSECSSSYNTYESLITHGRRKKHKILDKSAFKTVTVPKANVKSSSITNLNQALKRDVILLPKGSTSLQLINCNSLLNLVTCEKGSQTDILTEKPRLSKKISKAVSNSRETQTLSDKRLTAETQTIGDYFAKKSIKCEQEGFTLCEEDLSRKSIKTQTKPVNSHNSGNTERNHSGTQTTNKLPTELLYSTPQNTHYSTHTNTTDMNEFKFMHSSSQTSFNEDMDMFDSENYFNCNSETQTDFMSMLNTDYCSNMYTQTCDNLLLNELGFISSHTQTVFDDVLKSVESQTMMSAQPPKIVLNCRDMAHMETQTDIEFQQMLEDINDYCSNMYTQTCDSLLLNELGFISSHTQTVFDDVLKSVESQTMMSAQPPKIVLNCRDMAHMETQTDVEFQQMLEEINA